MSSPGSGYSIMTRITKTEDAIKFTYERINELKKRINEEYMPDQIRNDLEKELEEARKLLKTHEDQLAHLRTHNRSTFIFVAALIFVIFAVYMLYILLGGSDF